MRRITLRKAQKRQNCDKTVFKIITNGIKIKISFLFPNIFSGEEERWKGKAKTVCYSSDSNIKYLPVKNE